MQCSSKTGVIHLAQHIYVIANQFSSVSLQSSTHSLPLRRYSAKSVQLLRAISRPSIYLSGIQRSFHKTKQNPKEKPLHPIVPYPCQQNLLPTAFSALWKVVNCFLLVSFSSLHWLTNPFISIPSLSLLFCIILTPKAQITWIRPLQRVRKLNSLSAEVLGYQITWKYCLGFRP